MPGDEREVLSAVFVMDSPPVLREAHAEAMMELILNAPVAADLRRKELEVCGVTRDVVGAVDGQVLVEANALDEDGGVQVGPGRRDAWRQ
jgi:hypothetical protein